MIEKLMDWLCLYSFEVIERFCEDSGENICDVVHTLGSYMLTGKFCAEYCEKCRNCDNKCQCLAEGDYEPV